jgi:hypothetical protein
MHPIKREWIKNWAKIEKCKHVLIAKKQIIRIKQAEPKQEVKGIAA